LRQQFVLFVADVLTEERNDAVQDLLPLGGSGLQPLQSGHQLVDLLMLEFHPQSELMPFWQNTTEHGHRTDSSANA
jgi:hypothetical protein